MATMKRWATITPLNVQQGAVQRAVVRRCSSTVAPRAQAATLTEKATKVRLVTKSDCELAVSIYPMFKYNAVGGGGSGTVQPLGGDMYSLKFDASTLVIPALNYKTASILGLPIPPPLNIAIVPSKLEGTLNKATGEINLQFAAEFKFTAGPIYTAAPLVVETTLTTDSSSGLIHSSNGSRLSGTAARLVGVARVPRVDDVLLNTFLQLPTDALAIMSADISFE